MALHKPVPVRLTLPVDETRELGRPGSSRACASGTAGGATWAQVAAATGRGEAQARRDYREWAADEHRLWVDYNGEFGIDDAEYAAAIARANPPAD